jgi:Flp pilus assembly protein TadG
MIRRRSPHRLARDKRGVSLVEFGLIAFPLCLTILALFDLGWRMYVTSVVQGVLFRASRLATIGTYNSDQIDTFVRTQLYDFSKSATVTIYKAKYGTFTGVGQPETITSDTAPVGSYNLGDCFKDTNGNGHWDADQGTAGLGGSNDIIYYQVTISYPAIMPMPKMLGWSGTETVTSNTVLRNQPYGVSSSANDPDPICPTS